MPCLRSHVSQVGDWGRLGQYNQSLVAEAMAFRADKLQPDFVLGMGDNFYPSTFQDLRRDNPLSTPDICHARKCISRLHPNSWRHAILF